MNLGGKAPPEQKNNSAYEYIVATEQRSIEAL